jgi:hypothetical protein
VSPLRLVSRTARALGSLLALTVSAVSAVSAGADAVRPDAGPAPYPDPLPASKVSTASVAPVVPEQPYKLGERPRADGTVVASVDDEAIARWNIGGSSNPACPSNRLGFHPAPRVKVDTTTPRGRLPPRSTSKGVLSELGVLAQTRNRGYWPFRLCFEAGLRRNALLAGKTRLRMMIGPGGRVWRSRLASTELRDEEVSTCLVTQTRSLRFAPSPRRPVEVELTVDLTPGDAPLPDGPPARARALADPGPGKLDARAALAALTPTVPGIATCYAEGRAKDPGLWGRVALRFDAAANGVIIHAAEHETHFPAPGVVGCILTAVRSAVLPAVEGGPLRFVWGVRLGAPPPQETAGNVLTPRLVKSSVADSPSPRVRLGP